MRLDGLDTRGVVSAFVITALGEISDDYIIDMHVTLRLPPRAEWIKLEIRDYVE